MNSNGVLDIKAHSNEKIYLDFNATTPLSEEVLEAITYSLKHHWFNPSGQYEAANHIKGIINNTRNCVRSLINANEISRIVFVSGGTEANNMVFHSILKYSQSKMIYKKNELPHFIISSIEHDSVKLIAEYYKDQGLVDLTEVKVNKNGLINIDDVVNTVRPSTLLISIMLANNETGVIQPISLLSKKLLELGYNNPNNVKTQRIFIHTDAAQAIGKIEVDVEELGVDYLTIVGHKFNGPRNGALYIRQSAIINDILNPPLYSIFYGGGQEDGFRSGTENTAFVVGLGKACEIAASNLQHYKKTTEELRDYLEESLEETFGKERIRFNGKSCESIRLPNTSNISFIGSKNLKGYNILSKTKLIQASTGASCHSNVKKASRVLTNMGVPFDIATNSIRISISYTTTKEEIDIAIIDLKKAVDLLISEETS